MRRLLGLGAVMVLVSVVAADPLDPIPSDQAKEIAGRLLEGAGTLTDVPFKIAGDSDKAAGLFKEGVGGLMVVPQRGLNEDTKGVEDANGAPVGYLFLHKLTPTIDGKAVDAAKRPTINLKDGNGTEREIAVLHLAVKKVSDTEWKLLVFGKDKKAPLMSATFREQANKADLPLTVEVKDIQNESGTLVVTLHGKYAADVPLTKIP